MQEVEGANVTKYEPVKIKDQLSCFLQKEAISAMLVITSKHKSQGSFTVAT
jgi:hypothetical protein